MAYAAVISVMNALDSLEFSPRIRVYHLNKQLIHKVWDGLKSLQEILKRLDESSKGSSRKKVNALDAEIKDAVWKFQDVFEFHIYDQLLVQSDSYPIRYLVLNLRDLTHDINCFVEMLKEKGEEYLTLLDNLDFFPEEDEASTTQTAGGRGKFKMVGHSIDMLWEVIRTKLDSSDPLDVVPVVGMAGIGKTAVARELFDDPELELDCRAWVSVGRKPPSIHTIKRDILTQLDPASKDRKKIRERDVEHLLKGIFKANKRCLLVLDDVWDTIIWDELRILFPDYGGGGKNLVLITTRLRHVGDEVDQSWSRTRHQVQLLDEDDSWDLLRHRVFGEEEECPVAFIKSGEKIAEKCDGLPLMIIAVAAFLLEAEMTPEFWEEVAEKESNHPIFTAAYDQLYEVLLPSYEYLPQHLKPCFLHMGVFPKYVAILRSKFLWLWDYEGFLDPTIEDCFHVYLWELMDHSVAMVCQTGSLNTDGIKTCRLHSTFWYLCRREATATKFCRVLTSRDDGFQQLSMEGQRRLSFHNDILFAMKDLIDSVEEACASSARSLLLYGISDPYPVPICFGLRLLKLLDVPFLRFYEFPEQVIQLVFLRYLALTCNNALPPSISRLWDLHYLRISRHEMIRFSGETPRVPIDIWDMKQLEYMDIQGWNLPNPPRRGRGRSWSLDRLQTLVGVGAETCTRKVLERIPDLAKLGIQIESNPEGDDMERVLDHLSNIYLLPQLLSLKCIVLNPVLVMGKGVVPPASMFPSSLTKLLLSGTGYSWEYMSIIGSLPNLKVLKLGSYAFRGPEWVIRYAEFRALRFLLIEGTDLVHFEVEDRGLFSLRHFYISNCYKLKHLVWEPDLSYPVVIEIYDCSPATAAFAGEMRSRYEAHYQMQDRFQVIVQSSWV